MASDGFREPGDIAGSDPHLPGEETGPKSAEFPRSLAGGREPLLLLSLCPAVRADASETLACFTTVPKPLAVWKMVLR